MKRRLSSSDSSTALITICPSSTEEHSPRNSHQQMYGGEFQSMLEGLEEEEAGHRQSEKKRRLSVDQVKALEKNFEVENKLEPERKVKLAQELGLQPRQVAVWFQNRRARWKTKQLERDYGLLKANYDALKLNYDTLNHDNQALRKQIKELKSRVQEEKKGSGVWVKEEMLTMPAESEEKSKSNETSINPSNSESEEEDRSNLNNKTSVGGTSVLQMDGSSDSDSSAILNEDNNNNSPISSDLLQPLKLSCSISTMNCFQTQYVKMEEHNFFSADEACNFFSDEQAPTLHWYCPDQWS